jgi:putative oxygen-independent coproporphyrinogen III oxidase
MVIPTPLSLYIHWPFCVSKCPYCDFNSHVRASIDQKKWLEALIADLRAENEATKGFELQSIFFGGGTPSLMPPATVAALIDAAITTWRVSPNLEISLEANPSSVEAAAFADLAAAGVNRVSLGLQSLDDERLKFLGRAHNCAEARQALDVAQSHFPRVNVDLIYALPDQAIDDWQSELTKAISFGATHMSLYQLTIEPGTHFETLVRKGTIKPLDADAAAEHFELTQEFMNAAGLPAYEISNHAVPGQECRHNLCYWRYNDYVGIGPGAHGRRGGVATVQHKKPENWLASVQRKGSGMQSETLLTPEEQAKEALVMGLRLAEGVDLAKITDRTGLNSLIDEDRAARLAKEGLVKRQGSRLLLEEPGRLLLDAILAELVIV